MGLLANARGVVTVGRRRGLGYFRYLLTGFAVPGALYRFGWGPSAPAAARRMFEAAGRMTAPLASLDQLRDADLLAEARAPRSPDPASPADVAALMDRAHGAGITGVRAGHRFAAGPDGRPRFAELPGARFHKHRGSYFLAERDVDRRAYNARYGATLLTESDARSELRSLKANVPQGYRDYAPIDFGGGLAIGQFASTDSGTGRWDFFNGRIVGPLIKGRRVLDLGSNNGSMPLAMLRAGAGEVVAVEFTPAIADFARTNAKILAWRDMRNYRIDVLTGDMRIFLTADLGTFDVVTAFCSLYYLPEEDMARIIAKAAGMGASLVLQANDAIFNLPAQTTQLRQLMIDNGYPDVEVHAFPGFARPLLVGRTPNTAGMCATAPAADAASSFDQLHHAY
jgi:2-polyprenyl-3-methyl-5-hydroxy-6-metoxy-1,4-benzoquinol methylase